MVIIFTTPKRELLDGWSRWVRVGDAEYALRVKRGRSVRAAFKPRGQNRGWEWWGSVYHAAGGRVWEGRVISNIGCRGLLRAAGVAPRVPAGMAPSCPPEVPPGAAAGVAATTIAGVGTPAPSGATRGRERTRNG